VNKTLRVLLLSMVCLWQVNSNAQEDQAVEVIVPDNLDPNEGSGWLQMELAIVVDDREQTLTSESWPPYPKARYPVRHRRLRDPVALQGLEERYPETTITQDLEGAITLEVPDPEQVLKAELAAAAAAEASAKSAHSNAVETIDVTDSLPTEMAATAQDTIPLEMLNEPGMASGAGADWLTDYTDAPPVNELEAEERRDPVLPASFVRRSPVLLQAGLRRYTETNPDRLVYSAGWLQPPGGPNLPIVLDNSGDATEWPQLQGFLQLRTGDDLRLGINVWWNTDASYLPEGFRVDAPPAAPAQYLWRDAETGVPLNSAEVEQRQTRLQEIARKKAEGLPLVEYVDPNTGFFRTLEPPQRETEDPTPENPWPWQHFIHVADTRAIPEGYVRYFDHPVLKVIATWRELSWGEVYQLGAEERERSEVEEAVEEAMAAPLDTTDP